MARGGNQSNELPWLLTTKGLTTCDLISSHCCRWYMLWFDLSYTNCAVFFHWAGTQQAWGPITNTNNLPHQCGYICAGPSDWGGEKKPVVCKHPVSNWCSRASPTTQPQHTSGEHASSTPRTCSSYFRVHCIALHSPNLSNSLKQGSNFLSPLSHFH